MLRFTILAVTVLLATSACTSTTQIGASSAATSSPLPASPSPVPSSPDFDVGGHSPDEPVLSYWMDGGECSSPCHFRVDVFTNGTVNYVAYYNVRFTEQADVAPLLDAIASASLDELVIGSDDCGREYDGNAPTIEITGVVIDTCRHVVDPENAIVQAAGRFRARIGNQVPLLGYNTIDELRATASAASIDTTAPGEWPSAVVPAACSPLYATNPNADSYNPAIAVEPSADICNVWIYPKNGDPRLCPIPRSWPGEITVFDAFRCPGS